MNTLVAGLNNLFYTPSPLSFGAAFLWGLFSVILSPCHLGAIPLIVGYVNDGKAPDRKRALLLSLLFALGLLVMLAAVGVVTSLLGRIMGDIGSGLTIGLGVFLVLCGLWLTEIPPFNKISLSVNMKNHRRGPLGALLLGLVYGVVLGPCSFAFLAPMLGFVFSAGRNEVFYGAFLMLFYALGHTLAIVAAGTFGDRVSAFLKARGSEKAVTWFKRILGILVVAAGLYVIYGAIAGL